MFEPDSSIRVVSNGIEPHGITLTENYNRTDRQGIYGLRQTLIQMSRALCWDLNNLDTLNDSMGYAARLSRIDLTVSWAFIILSA